MYNYKIDFTIAGTNIPGGASGSIYFNIVIGMPVDPSTPNHNNQCLFNAFPFIYGDGSSSILYEIKDIEIDAYQNILFAGSWK